MKLKHHIKKAHKIGKFRCEYCDEISYEWIKYKTHRETVHKELLKTFKCTHLGCELSFKTEGVLNEHVKTTHLGVKDFHCELCGKMFTSKVNLRVHIETIHEKRKDHKCPQCNKEFGQRSSLKTHIDMVHKGIRKHKCPTCGKGFSSLNQLKGIY